MKRLTSQLLRDPRQLYVFHFSSNPVCLLEDDHLAEAGLLEQVGHVNAPDAGAHDRDLGGLARGTENRTKLAA